MTKVPICGFVLVAIADAISSTRHGARRETMKRLSWLVYLNWRNQLNPSEGVEKLTSSSGSGREDLVVVKRRMNDEAESTYSFGMS